MAIYRGDPAKVKQPVWLTLPADQVRHRGVPVPHLDLGSPSEEGTSAASLRAESSVAREAFEAGAEEPGFGGE